MRIAARLGASWMLWMAGCGGATTTPTTGPTSGATPAEPVVLTPRTESIRLERGLGSGASMCMVYLYEWNAEAPGCKVSLTHCSRDGACLACMDERQVACGETIDVCGEPAKCECPTGEPQAVPDAPGTVVLANDGSGAAFEHAERGATCNARPTTMGGAPADGAPCVVAIHECERSGTCVDRTQMLSCRVRGEICGRPVVCRCGGTAPTGAAAGETSGGPPPAQAAAGGRPCE